MAPYIYTPLIDLPNKMNCYQVRGIERATRAPGETQRPVFSCWRRSMHLPSPALLPRGCASPQDFYALVIECEAPRITRGVGEPATLAQHARNGFALSNLALAFSEVARGWKHLLPAYAVFNHENAGQLLSLLVAQVNGAARGGRNSCRFSRRLLFLYDSLSFLSPFSPSPRTRLLHQ